MESKRKSVVIHGEDPDAGVSSSGSLFPNKSKANLKTLHTGLLEQREGSRARKHDRQEQRRRTTRRNKIQ